MPRSGQVVDRSHSDGRGVWETWCELFEANEKAWKEGKLSKVLTDPQLTAEMRKRFPRRQSRLMEQVNRLRAAYNRQRRFVSSFRYLRDEETKDVCRATARGWPISEWRTLRRK